MDDICLYDDQDVLQIHDGNVLSDVPLAAFQGCQFQDPIVSSGSDIYIRFASTSQNAERVFEISFTSLG